MPTVYRETFARARGNNTSQHVNPVITADQLITFASLHYTLIHAFHCHARLIQITEKRFTPYGITCTMPAWGCSGLSWGADYNRRLIGFVTITENIWTFRVGSPQSYSEYDVHHGCWNASRSYANLYTGNVNCAKLNFINEFILCRASWTIASHSKIKRITLRWTVHPKNASIIRSDWFMFSFKDWRYNRMIYHFSHYLGITTWSLRELRHAYSNKGLVASAARLVRKTARTCTAATAVLPHNMATNQNGVIFWQKLSTTVYNLSQRSFVPVSKSQWLSIDTTTSARSRVVYTEPLSRFEKAGAVRILINLIIIEFQSVFIVAAVYVSQL